MCTHNADKSHITSCYTSYRDDVDIVFVFSGLFFLYFFFFFAPPFSPDRRTGGRCTAVLARRNQFARLNVGTVKRMRDHKIVLLLFKKIYRMSISSGTCNYRRSFRN